MSHRKIKLAMEATEIGAVLFSGPDTSAQFDRRYDHVCSLLRAYTLFTTGSLPTAVFWAILAIKEVAKLEIVAFRRPGRTAPTKRRSDDLTSTATN
ncbi:MAG: hypothetical protein CBARDCOR_2933 [uncultured Caballeronia sp.]|nr:MAG: hypothetical protein CBARDCOR_2933 [uncultured Caballeronia sp.]